MKSILFIFTILFCASIYGQSLRFGPSVGFTFPNTQDLTALNAVKSSLEFDGDLHYGAKLKFGLPVAPVTITGGFIYSKISGNLTGVGDVEQSVLSISAGGEYAIIPGPIQPYGAVDLMYTSTGDIEINNISMDNASGRMGLGVGAGVDVQILPVDIDVSVKYAFNNLIGKEDDEESFNTINVTLSLLFGL